MESLVRALAEHLQSWGGRPLLCVFDRPKTIPLKWQKKANGDGYSNSTGTPAGRRTFSSRRTCPRELSLPEFPESICHNFRNPHVR